MIRWSRAGWQLAFVGALALGPASPAGAQNPDVQTADLDGQAWLDRCRRDDRGWGDRERYCEVRVLRLDAQRSLDVDGRQNGGVRVHGWDRDEVRVVAHIQTEAEDDSEAKSLASRIEIAARDGRVRAEGPPLQGHSNWSVSYELWVPHATDLTVNAQNGGLSVDDVEGHVDLSTVNGGISVRRVAGDVRGQTTNGSVNAVLEGERWEGTGLELQTTNGSVNLSIPDGYSARLETGTINGGMRVEFPITVQGTIGRRLTTQLGRGGPPIRALTVNGSVNIRRR